MTAPIIKRIIPTGTNGNPKTSLTKAAVQEPLTTSIAATTEKTNSITFTQIPTANNNAFIIYLWYAI
jgi:hypothetical protein